VISILLGILVSTFYCYLNRDQSILLTLIAQRSVYWLAFYFVLIYIQPSQDEIFSALKYFTLIFIFIWLYQYLIFPNSIIKMDEERLIRYSENEGDGIMIPGRILVLLFYYWVLSNLIEKVSVKNLTWVVALITVFVLMQNRGTLFPIILITLIGAFNIRGRYKTLTRVLGFIIILISALVGFNIIRDLILETSEQFNNSDYARWISFFYWITEFPKNIAEYILGSGYDNLQSTYGLAIYNLKVYQGIYRSDLGIIGFWSMFGLISTIPIYLLIYRILRYWKKHPLFLIFIILHLLIMPISFAFWNSEGAILLALLFYLYDLNQPIKFRVINEADF
jgi:hypothetical protein